MSRHAKRTARQRAFARTVLLWVGLLLLLTLANAVRGVLFAPIYDIRPVNPETWIARRAVSGQTIEVVAANDPVGVVQRVRLAGISAPLREQEPFGDRAREKLQALVPPDTNIQLEFDAERKDDFDRLLAYVWVQNRLINLQLVQEGYALADSRPPNDRYKRQLDRAQSIARLLGEGIWDPAKPLRLTPAEFRRQLS